MGENSALVRRPLWRVGELLGPTNGKNSRGIVNCTKNFYRETDGLAFAKYFVTLKLSDFVSNICILTRYEKGRVVNGFKKHGDNSVLSLPYVKWYLQLFAI